MKICIPKGAERIINLLEADGHEAYVVGGCVRDALLFREPNDWDICTSATPEEVICVFSEAETGNDSSEKAAPAVKESESEGSQYHKKIKIIPTGIKHGTVTIVFDRSSDEEPVFDIKNPERDRKNAFETYEVTTFRVDGEYTDHRRPDDVVFVKSLKEDLARRDFTINAMAYSDEKGLIDPFGGAADLEKKVIRCVGDPEKRFEEDALRILRCIRFASQLCFEIEENTAAAMRSKLHLLDDIAAERIRSEFDKLMCGSGAYTVLKEYPDIIAQFIPEIIPMIGLDQENPFHLYDVWMHTLNAVRSIHKNVAQKNGGCTEDINEDQDSSGCTPVLYLAAFFHDIGKPPCKVVDRGWGHFYGHEQKGAEMTDEIMHRLRYDNETRKTVVRLIAKHGIVFNPHGKQAGRLLHRLGERDLRLLIELERADVSAQHPDYVGDRLANIAAFEKKVDDRIAQSNVFSMRDLAIDGRDIISLGVSQGKEIGRIKAKLLEMVVDEEIENEREALLKQVTKMIE